MKQFYLSTTLVTIIMFTLPNLQTQLYAQNWQWGQSGGSSDGGVASGPDEYAKDIAVDPNGNTYVLSHSVGKASLKVGGQVVSTNFGSYDVMLASFNCEGQLRWQKVIGCTREDHGWALQTDNNGGVYFAIISTLFSGAGTNTINFDSDYILNVNNTQGGKSFKTLHLVKYDTSGTFQWVKSPQADTVGPYSHSNTGIISIDVDASGTIYCLSMLPEGLFEGSYSVSSPGTHVLKYSNTGAFLGGVELDMKFNVGTSGRYTYLKKGQSPNEFIVSGTVQYLSPVFVANKQIKGAKHISTFSSNGSLLWSRSDTIFSINNGIANRPAIDDSGNIYIVANTDSFPDSKKNDYFNGYTTKLASTKYAQAGVLVMKMDKNGNMLWADNAFVNNACFTGGVALRSSGEVVVGGWYGGLLRFDDFKDSLFFGPNASYRPFIVRFNTQTGKVLALEDIVTTGDTKVLDLISDGRNNIYISGEMKGSMTVNGNTLSSVGGPKDFYIAKYGHSNCNCTDIPEPMFTQTVTNHFTYDFTYTGSAATTIEWDFGDGTTSTQANPSHTYTSPNDFIACVKVTNNCGDNIYCAKISTKWPDNVATLSSNSNVKIYPNPVSDILHIDGISPGSRIELFDVLGRKAHMITTASEKEAINITHLPQGNYFIQITFPNGERITGKVLKQ